MIQPGDRERRKRARLIPGLEVSMDSTEIATKVAQQVVSDTKFWIAVIGIIGGIVGSLFTLAGNVLLHWLKNRPQKKLDEMRKQLLIQMLDDDRFPQKWRSLATISAVVGADENETKRLLIEAGARGSEKNDGKWGLLKLIIGSNL